MVEGTVKRRQVMRIKLNANICTYFLSNLFLFYKYFLDSASNRSEACCFFYDSWNKSAQIFHADFRFLSLVWIIYWLAFRPTKTKQIQLFPFRWTDFLNLKPNILQQVSQTKTIEYMVVCKLLCHRSRKESGTTKGITKNEKQVTTEARSNDSTVLTCSIKEQLKI